jgi:superfamily II DNA or RNA helicase/HKD family nuclease
MSNPNRGLYEQLVTAALESGLTRLGDGDSAVRGKLDPEEAADRIALHLTGLVRRAIAGLNAAERTVVGLQLTRQISALLIDASRAVDAGDLVSPAGDVLRAIVGLLPDGTTAELAQPATPLLDTTLLTNAPGEPRIGFQLQTEIPSADRIDVLMAFVRQTGIRPLLEALRRHTGDGKPLRLLTTTYTGSTELAALEALQKAGAQIRVSYDTSSTRLHAKAWLFHRASGFSTAFIGSSNLTHSAQVTGLEWNVRVAGARNPDVVDKFTAIFNSYWNGDEFRLFDSQEFRELTEITSTGPRVYLSPVEIRLEPFQSRLLEQIELARLQGRHRNLLVSATGTGKTVMAALDYQRLRARLPRARLLFLAHRREILDQSQATFRHALRDASFGEAWVGGERPKRFDHVFASIQSLTASGIDNIAPDHFDVVIIDEFHHAAARTYEAVLDRLNPRELLGLTATPERGDGLPILHWFGDRISAELRLWDAIEQHRLSPFSYYGISDGVDYRSVPWRRGRGYDLGALGSLVTGDHVLARRVIASVVNTVPDPSRMRALGFCVSVGHARFMAQQFNAAGLPSVAVEAATSSAERKQALSDLAAGRIRVVFSVDLFNEGVDVPAVDTLILLRPTDSPTIFLQQLGRGLRRDANKSVCTVLDFVGQHHNEFQFHRRFGALIGGGRKHIAKQIEDGFPFLPSGCHMELDPVAASAVLQNIRQSLPSNMPGRAAELRRVADGSQSVTLKEFLDASGLALEDVYSGNHCWSDLLSAGGLPVIPGGPNEGALRRALGRLIHVDDPLRIGQYRQFALMAKSPDMSALTLRSRRLFHMLATVLTESAANAGETLADAAKLIWEHPQVLLELGQLMDVLADRVDHIQAPLEAKPEVPLLIHARYTRREILAAFGDGTTLKTPEWREGARYLPEEKVDVLAFTLDKTSGHFSPTTRYRDYAINRELLHWESQSTIRAESNTGLRYQNHAATGSTVLPFARLSTDDRAFWLLGPAMYQSHDGERPMAITWKLTCPLSGDLFSTFAAAVA